MRDIERFRRVRYGRFYIHRALRLVPALAFMLAGFAVIEGIWNILGDRGQILRSIIVGMTYTMNVPRFDHGSDALSHLWTLATEEQFYLVWPIVLTFAIRAGRTRTSVMLCIVAVTILCATTIFIAQPDVWRVYMLPTSWCVAMLLGAFVYLEKERISKVLGRDGIGRLILPSLAMAALLILSVLPEAKAWPGTYLLTGPFIACCTVVIVFEAARWQGTCPRLVSPLLGLGTISYAAYLWNYPVATWMGERPLSFVQGTLTIVLTIIAAAASWYLVERPLRPLKSA